MERKQSMFGGALQNADIESLKHKICDYIRVTIMRFNKEYPCSAPLPDKFFWLSKNLFNGHGLDINSKNIEYKEWFCLSDTPTDDVVIQKMNQLGFVDVSVQLTIYRVGQHSYWTAEPTLVQPALDTGEQQ